jgi:hypothetical protein
VCRGAFRFSGEDRRSLASRLWSLDIYEVLDVGSMAPSAQRAMDFPTLCVSVNSVDSVRAYLPPDSCAPTFHGGFIPGFVSV